MSGSEQLIRDFAVAAGLLGVGEPELALRCVLPCQVPVSERVPAMVAVGCLLTGAVGGVRLNPLPAGRRPVSPLTHRLIRAGAELDDHAIRDLITAHRVGVVLLDVLIELMIEFDGARRAAGRPLVELASPVTPGGRPVSTPGGGGCE